jgi:hypothetical protein
MRKSELGCECSLTWIFDADLPIQELDPLNIMEKNDGEKNDGIGE